MLEDSGVSNKDDWKIWRHKVRTSLDTSEMNYGKAASILRNLRESKPVLIKQSFINKSIDVNDYNSIQEYKAEIIRALKRKYSKFLLDAIVNSGDVGLFDIILNKDSESNKQIAESYLKDMNKYISAVENTSDIKTLKEIFKRANGYRY
jgi:hypothetical protein